MFKRLLFLVMVLPFSAQSAPVQVLDKVVAIVNDGVITTSELDAQVSALKQQLEAKKVNMPTPAALRKQVLQHLIDVDLQLQLAKQNDIVIDSAELNAAIKKIADANKISLTELREAIAREGLTWPEYRKNVRKEMIISRLQQSIVGKEVVISTEQVEDYLKTASFEDKTKQTFHLQNIVIPLAEEPTTDEVNSARKKVTELLAKIHKGDDFSTLAIAESSGQFALEGGDLGERHLAELPEIFAKEVVRMSKGQVVGPIRTGNGFQLIKLVSIGGDDGHHQITKTHARHILLKPDAGTTAAEAERQANNLYQQLKSGKDFAVMAKQYSLDAASAIKGGDLGWVNPGELVPEFEHTMDRLPLHKVSKPVKSQFGWHIIEVVERKTVDDSVNYQRQRVRQFLHERKFTEAVQNWQQHLRADAYIKILDKKLA